MIHESVGDILFVLLSSPQQLTYGLPQSNNFLQDKMLPGEGLLPLNAGVAQNHAVWVLHCLSPELGNLLHPGLQDSTA